MFRRAFVATTQRRGALRAACAPVRALHASTPLRKIVPFKLADIGEGIAEVEVLEWFVKEGDTVQQFDKLCEVQSDKATVEITSKFDGVVVKLHTPVGEMAAVGSPLVDIDDGEEDNGSASTSEAPKQAQQQQQQPQQPQQQQQQTQQQSSSVNTSERKAAHEILATPAVRRLARENKIDLAIVPGTGKAGRILKEDMLRFLESPSSSATSAAATPVSAAPLRASNSGAEEWREPVRGVLRTMIKTMTAAAQVPHLGYCDEIVMDKLMSLRSRLKPVAQQRGLPSLSFLPFMIKAASMALHQYPVLNARLSEDGTEVIHRRAHNIGFAMASDEGLLVPNVKNVDQLSIFEVAVEVNRIIEAGRSGKLPPADLQGGSLTLSNIGTVGGTYTSPVLLLPEVVIGGFGKTQRLPRFDDNDNVVPVNIMPVSWSADHRLVDGVTIASFSNAFKGYLETPGQFIFDLK